MACRHYVDAQHVPFPYDVNLFVSDQEFAQLISTLKPAARVRQTKITSKTTENRMLTENGDGAFISSKNPLVDLFFELTDDFDAARMEVVLTTAWSHNPLATLKIIFNARSIHLGKATRPGAYKALGWLYMYHPQTFLANLVWLVRPVIDQTPVGKSKTVCGKTRLDSPAAENSEDFEMIDAPKEFNPISISPAALAASTKQYDIANGGAHGYWKDLPNILALAVNRQFHLKGDIRSVLNVDNQGVNPRDRNWSAWQASCNQHEQKLWRYHRAINTFNDDPKYRALHLTIARLFADQLQADAAVLNSGRDLNKVSMAAKWTPSSEEFHDRHTWIVGSIAELLHPRHIICPQVEKDDRKKYLMYARMSYRSVTVSPLRKHLRVVERDITAGTFDSINYERVPSLAMENYQGIFFKKDEDRFNGYLDKVASGKAKISGAILLPSRMVHKARTIAGRPGEKKKSAAQVNAQERVLEGQWKSLVKRMKNSGSIQGAIGVCDVSSSMSFKQFRDGTTPMDSAIGLSLLLAEVVDGPFGGHFISFHCDPRLLEVGGPSDSRSFREKVEAVRSAPWGLNTDFIAVFEKLILPVAIENKIKPEDMIKQVFVFSDMQFDEASQGVSPSSGMEVPKWSSSFERINKLYLDAGYEMPTLVFWNLAGDQGKPVTTEEPGTALVSGCSQGQLKMFLDGGKFDKLEEVTVVEDADMAELAGDYDDLDVGMVNIRVTKKQKVDPLVTVMRAISHPAYAMLKVID